MVGPRSQSSSTALRIGPQDAYGLEAEYAAREAEANRREAALRRAEFRAPPVRRADDVVEDRLAELADREQALAGREQLIRALEARLEEARRHLEERLKQFEERKAAQCCAVAGDGRRRLPPVPAGYFAHSSYPKEAEWWAMRLGRTPQLPDG